MVQIIQPRTKETFYRHINLFYKENIIKPITELECYIMRVTAEWKLSPDSLHPEVPLWTAKYDNNIFENCNHFPAALDICSISLLCD